MLLFNYFLTSSRSLVTILCSLQGLSKIWEFCKCNTKYNMFGKIFMCLQLFLHVSVLRKYIVWHFVNIYVVIRFVCDKS